MSHEAGEVKSTAKEGTKKEQDSVVDGTASYEAITRNTAAADDSAMPELAGPGNPEDLASDNSAVAASTSTLQHHSAPEQASQVLPSARPVQDFARAQPMGPPSPAQRVESKSLFRFWIPFVTFGSVAVASLVVVVTLILTRSSDETLPILTESSSSSPPPPFNPAAAPTDTPTALATLPSLVLEPLRQKLEGDDDTYFGKTLALSSDGSILAASSQFNEDNRWVGNASTFTHDTTGRWVRLAQTIPNGKSVALSRDGSVLAVSDDSFDGYRRGGGIVQVFELLNGSRWLQVGQDIAGPAFTNLGSAASLSLNGSTLAVASTQKRYVRVLSLEDGDWVRLGGDIQAGFLEERFGSSLSISGNGRILAIGSPLIYASGGGFRSGVARCFFFNGTDWLQRGNDLNSTSSEEGFGDSVSLSVDGNILAVGATDTRPNTVRVYRFVGADQKGSWEAFAPEIEGPNDAFFGSSVALSDNGYVVAVGALSQDDNGEDSGALYVFQYNKAASRFVLVAYESGEGEEDGMGTAVALSGDGTMIVTGARSYNHRGYVKAFLAVPQVPTWSPSPTFPPSLSPTTSPTVSFAPSPMPTSSQEPSFAPTAIPSHAPSVSPAPSLRPSRVPTRAPSASPLPSSNPTYAPTFVCEADEVLVEIDVETDLHPEDTSFELVNATGGIIWSNEDESELEANTEYHYSTCLDCSGNFTFIVLDSFGDGICCKVGQGSYRVSYDFSVVASGGEFEDRVTVQLGSACTPPLLCGPSEGAAKIGIRTDNFATETSFELSRDTGGVIWSNDDEGELQAESYHRFTTCLDDSACYNFTLHDSAGDGICCTHGDGFFSVSYNNTEVASGGQFQDLVEVLFGSGCNDGL